MSCFPTGIHREEIEKVVFFKRDELCTDLICCEITQHGQPFHFHEEWRGWDDLIEALKDLAGFRTDWFAKVSQPPFATSTFVAFQRTLS